MRGAASATLPKSIQFYNHYKYYTAALISNVNCNMAVMPSSYERRKPQMLENETFPALRISFCIFLLFLLQPSMALGESKNQYPYPISYYVEKYNFIESDIKNEIPPVAKENLQYFIDNIVSIIPLVFDAQLIVWWAYIEGSLSSKESPWIFSNCADKDNNANTDCIEHFFSGGWQVGYGIQVYDNIKSLEEAFKNTYQGKKPQEIGDVVLSNAGQKDIKFPQNLHIEQMVSNPYDYTDGKSNAYWASVLMRDPKISAYLLAPIVSNWSCYGKTKGESVSIPRWCGSNTWYSNKREEHSMMMKKIINTWKSLTPDTIPPSSPRNLQ